MKLRAATLTNRLVLFLGVYLCMSAATHAEIEKVAIPSDQGFSLYWWPKLPSLTGWHHDRDYSVEHSVNALAPDGFDFGSAEAVIYARAIYKPRVPETMSLQALLESDKKSFLGADSGIQISDAPPLVTADGQRLKSLTFFPSREGNWERVSYGEEGDFFVIFTVSGQSLKAFRAAESAYEALVASYSTVSKP